MSKRERKDEFSEKLRDLFSKYSKIIIVGADNVGSSHMQKIRVSLRGKGVLLMGKNTMIRRVIKNDYKNFEAVLPHIFENVGLLFTNSDLLELRDIINTQKVPAAAKAGAIAPIDVTVPAGDTGLEPTQTAFLQALNIATRINKGQIMILNPKQVITKGEKVGASEATLLQKLKIKPFSYGLQIRQIYDDGAVYNPSVLDITPDAIGKKIADAATRIAALSLVIGYPTLPSVPHTLSRAFKNLLSVALDTAITFPQAEEIKELLENPEALARAVAATSAPAANAPAAAAAAPEAAKPESSSESEEDMGFGLFD
jgi:large subunit ribosomal protein LP0